MKGIKVGLNGFGRIGRAFTRIALKKDLFDIALINTRKTKPEMLAYLLKHDSVYKTYDKAVTYTEDSIVIEDKKIKAVQISEPEKIPWDQYDVDVVIDATGVFTKKEDLRKHLKASVKKVILTAPAKDDMQQVVLGVNEKTIAWDKVDIISNASCTTNNSAPMFKLLNDHLQIISGFLTTIHAYTSTQSLLDESNKTKTRSRAAGINLVPTTTGAAKAVVKVIPELEGKIDGMAIRAPVPVGSFTDITVITAQQTSAEAVNAIFKQASMQDLKGILAYEENELVSSDYIGNSHSVIFDANYTKVINNNMVKVYGWYDNEWGYSHRLVDLVQLLAKYI